MVSYFFIAFLEYLVWDFIWARCLVWCQFVYCPLQLLFSDLEVACNLPILMDCCLVYVLRVCIWWWWKKGFLKGFCFLIVGCGTDIVVGFNRKQITSRLNLAESRSFVALS